MPAELKNVKMDDKYLVPYLNKLKRKEFPKSPKTTDEIISAFEDMEINKLYGKYYVHTQSSMSKNLYGFTVLCDRDIFKIINDISKREILLDGTFEIVKRGPYQQLLVIYIAHEKEVGSYEHMFNYVLKITYETKIENPGHNI